TSVETTSVEATSVEVTSLPAASTQRATQQTERNIELLLQELDALAQEIQRRFGGTTPLTPAQLLGMVNNRVGRFAPEMPREALRDLERNLEGTSFRDLVDPETLKGLFYVLSYTAQSSSASLREQVRARLAKLPGFGALAQLAGNLEGTSPRDLVDPDTWKGFWIILSHMAQQQMADARRRMQRQDEPSSE
ncbi:MAG TPA: hypothetical protein VNK95_16215, partial [Caldilineaceae bacterium]|nr:hypothetical protein [Caldilineaceae bacterium]